MFSLQFVEMLEFGNNYVQTHVWQRKILEEWLPCQFLYGLASNNCFDNWSLELVGNQENERFQKKNHTNYYTS